jgi:polysaccharide biosynthesis transport protein
MKRSAVSEAKHRDLEDRTGVQKSPSAELPREDAVDLRIILVSVARVWKVAALAFLITLPIALGGALLVPARYVASTKILLENRRPPVLQQQSLVGDPVLDLPAVETQIEVLSAAPLAKAVVLELGLDKIEQPGWLDGFKEALRTALQGIGLLSVPEVGRPSPADTATKSLLKNLSVTRIGRTFVLNISYRSKSPSEAIRVVDSLSRQYIDEQPKLKQQAITQTAVWLENRVGELRKQALSADRDVQDIRGNNRLADPAVLNRLEQLLADISEQLATKIAQKSEAEVRLAMARQGTIASEDISRIENELADAKTREQLLQGRWDLLNKEVSDARHIQAELGLREKAAKAVQESYANYLQRLMNVEQQNTFFLTEARILEPAEEAERQPRLVILALFAFLASVLVGLAVGIHRAFRRVETHRSREKVD